MDTTPFAVYSRESGDVPEESERCRSSILFDAVFAVLTEKPGSGVLCKHCERLKESDPPEVE